jgi:hypothetical protein
MKIDTFYNTLKAWLIILLIGFSLCGSAQEEYCCGRNLIFPEFPMPEEQERDISGFISTSWNSYIMNSGIHELLECPLMIELLSYTGVINLDSMIKRITSVATKKTPEFDSHYENLRNNADYIWKGKLELTYIERIVPGWMEPAYGGGTEYLPGYVVGGWKFTIQLYDIQHNEIVKEASTTWTGSDIGYYKNLKKQYDEGTSDKLKIDILEELYKREFYNLKQIIIDYEKAPKKAKFDSDQIKVNLETTKRITFKVTDEKGEKPKKWQRLAVKVDFGSLTNGTPCCDTGEDVKFYSFMCEEGEVTIEYKAPDPDRTTLDNITVFNGCIINSPDITGMSMIDIQDEIGVVNIALVNEGYSGTITITQSWDYADDYGNTFIGSKTVTCKGTYKPIEELMGKERQPLHWFGPSKVVATWEIKEDMYCGGDDCPGHCRQEFGQGTLAPDMWQELTIMTWVFPLEIKEVADQLGEIGMENYYVISVTPGLTDVITETREKGGDPCVWNVKQSEEDIPGAIIQYRLVDVDKLQGHRTWKSKHGATGYSIEITDMPDFQGEHVEPVKPVPDGTDFTYTVTWNLISL